MHGDTPAGNIIPVILSGGSGSRLWPLSRKLRPKQFLALYTDNSLFRDTLDRVVGDMFAPPLAICNDDHRPLLQRPSVSPIPIPMP